MTTWIKNAWYMAGWASELDGDGFLSRTILGQPLVLYRCEDGSVAVLEDRCCHRHAPLSKGRREGDCLRCMYHGLKFAADGICVEAPGQETIPAAMRVRAFPAVERQTLVWVWMGEAALADPATIPSWPYLTDPAWRNLEGYIHYQADYRLIVDNLLDFSHLAYVHENSIGNAGHATEKASLERIPEGLRVTKLAPNEVAAPHYKKFGGFSGNVDRWNIYDWHVRGNLLLLEGGADEVGKGGHLGDRRTAVEFRHISALSPETETTTHYFFAQSHNFAIESSEITRQVHEAVYNAFLEDKDMIAAQQKNIARQPHAPMQATVHDAALLHIRRRIDAAITQETRAKQAAE
jgi:phenylpropionate dioxygenase-like ring-hydroxylating dioxygenase large terminal subunit